MTPISVLRLSILLALTFGLFACGDAPIPKPFGYPRIDLPDHAYQPYDSDCPFQLDIHQQAIVVPRTEPGQQCWFDINYVRHAAKIHMSYKAVGDSVGLFLNQARSLAYKHSIKANNILERPYINEDQKVYGLLMEITGNSASTIQFYATDSVNHFLRGALYFNVKTNEDSLRPVIDYITQDIAHLMESLEWKDHQITTAD